MTDTPTESEHTRIILAHADLPRAEAIILDDCLHEIYMDEGRLSTLRSGLSYYPPGWKEVTLLRVIAERPDGESVVLLLHPGDDDGTTASDKQTDDSDQRTRTDRPQSSNRPVIFYTSNDKVQLEKDCEWVRGRCPRMQLQYVDDETTALEKGRWTAYHNAGKITNRSSGEFCPTGLTINTYTVDTSDLGATTAGSDDTDGTVRGSEPRRG